MRSIKCVNNAKNTSLTFSETGFTPFLLASADGLYEAKNNVYMSDNTMIDGSTYQGTTAKSRNIVLTLMDNPQGDFIYNQYNRDLLYNLFRKGDEGTLFYTENGETRKISYYTESVSRAPRGSRLFTVSLLCGNPRFADEHDKHVMMANWISDFEFVHEFKSECEELGHKSEIRLVNIINDKALDRTGITIEITANGNVINPKITRIESEEVIELGTEDKPFNMVRGDVLVITTATGNKHIRLTRDGITTEVNEYLTEESEFIQLMYGNNNIAYSAYEGDEYMTVNITYTNEYEGA